MAKQKLTKISTTTTKKRAVRNVDTAKKNDSSKKKDKSKKA